MPLLNQFVAAFSAALAESAPMVLAGLAIAGLLREFVPAKLLRRAVGGRGFAPVARSVGVGALLPICSCSVVPLGLGLTRSGASVGTALAFMMSSPAISPVTVILGLSVLGPAMTGWYSLAVILGALIIGLVGNRLLGEAIAADAPAKACGCNCGKPHSIGGRMASALRWSFGELGGEVGGSLVVGLMAASLLLVALPSSLVSEWLHEPSWLALLAAVLVSLPAYTCSVPSLMIGGALLAKGVAPGVVMTFLIAGPATNLGSLNAIRATLGLRTASFYAASLIGLSLAAGGLVGWLPLPPSGMGSAAFEACSNQLVCDHPHPLDAVVLGTASAESSTPFALWRWACSAAVITLAIVPSFQRLRRRLTSVSNSATVPFGVAAP